MLEQIQDKEDTNTVEINPEDLSLSTLKEISMKWLVEMSDYISDNPLFIVNGFIRDGITKL